MKVPKQVARTGEYMFRRMLGAVVGFFTYEALRRGKQQYQSSKQERIHRKYTKLYRKNNGKGV